jgi:hypothetical protein
LRGHLRELPLSLTKEGIFSVKMLP